MNNRLITRSFPVKIVVLWTAFLLGLLFHTQLALMPLFHGLSVAESHTHEVMNIDAVMWFMLVFFSLPLLLMVGTVLITSTQFHKLHFVLSILYTVLNIFHLGLDIVVTAPSYQLALMTLLLLIGLLINWVSYQWMKTSLRSVKRIGNLNAHSP